MMNRYSWERKEDQEMNRATRIAWGILIVLLSVFWLWAVYTYLFGVILYIIGASALVGIAGALMNRNEQSEGIGEVELLAPPTIAPEIVEAAEARRAKFCKLDSDRENKRAA